MADASEEIVETQYGDPEPSVKYSDRQWPRRWMGSFLDALSTMPVVSAAARQAQVNRQHCYNCRTLFPEFDAAWEEALQEGVELLEERVHRWGLVGVPVKETRTKVNAGGQVVEQVVTETTNINPTLAIFALKRHKPEYRESFRHEHTGAAGGPIEMSVKEKRDAAVERFNAEVVRLAAINAADDASSVSGEAS